MPNLVDCPGGVSDPNIKDVLAHSSDRQRAEILKFARVVHCGLLILQGPPGTCKTTAMCIVLEMRARAGDHVVAASGAISAVNNLYHRQHAINPDVDGRLYIRMYSPSMETRYVMAFKPSSTTKGTAPVIDIEKKQSAKLGYDLATSMAGSVCKLAGVVPTSNRVILELRLENTDLCSDMNKIMTDPDRTANHE